MAESGLRLTLEFRDDALSQDFSQLNTPLIERVDVPDDTLRKDAVLIESDKLAEGLGREPINEDRVRWPIAREDAMRHEPIRRALSLDLVGRLAKRQRFGLGKDVCDEHVVMLPKWVERFVERDEVAGNEPRALMNQLIERVLAIGARLAPIDGASIVVDALAVYGDVFAVALHGQLLQIGRESLQILLVGQHRDG